MTNIAINKPGKWLFWIIVFLASLVLFRPNLGEILQNYSDQKIDEFDEMRRTSTTSEINLRAIREMFENKLNLLFTEIDEIDSDPICKFSSGLSAIDYQRFDEISFFLNQNNNIAVNIKYKINTIPFEYDFTFTNKNNIFFLNTSRDEFLRGFRRPLNPFGIAGATQNKIKDRLNSLFQISNFLKNHKDHHLILFDNNVTIDEYDAGKLQYLLPRINNNEFKSEKLNIFFKNGEAEPIKTIDSRKIIIGLENIYISNQTIGFISTEFNINYDDCRG